MTTNWCMKKDSSACVVQVCIRLPMRMRSLSGSAVVIFYICNVHIYIYYIYIFIFASNRFECCTNKLSNIPIYVLRCYVLY